MIHHRDAIALCLRQRCKADQNDIGFGWGRVAWRGYGAGKALWRSTASLHRWVYAAKAAVCFALDRTHTDRKAAQWECDDLVVVATDNGTSCSTPDGTFYNWDEVVTPVGWGRGKWAAWTQAVSS